jgi:type IV pilus assembly protein PilM
MPHPPLAVEMLPDRVAGTRWTRTGGVEAFAVAALPPGALLPSAVDNNFADPGAVKDALGSVTHQLNAKQEDVALLLPDTVIRVFVQHFDEFPRSRQEAEPMLRWKLKKSVPFDADETVISYMRQRPRGDGVDVVTGLARMRIVREYEGLAETAGLFPGVVLSSSLAAIALVDDKKPTLLARVSGNSLTTAIVRDNALVSYRCTELPTRSADLTPEILLEEVYPVAAYYQDTWHEGIQAVRVAGLGARLEEFVKPLEDEFRCEVHSLLHSALLEGRVQHDARPLAERGLEGLVGWMLQKA